VDGYAHRLFGTAAAANFSVGLSLLFLRKHVEPLLGLDPITGTNLVFFYLSGTLIVTFGYAYLRIALDPRTWHSVIQLGAIGKLLAVASAAWPWLAGEVGGRLPLLASIDLVFALLFIHYLRRTSA